MKTLFIFLPAFARKPLPLAVDEWRWTGSGKASPLTMRRRAKGFGAVSPFLYLKRKLSPLVVGASLFICAGFFGCSDNAVVEPTANVVSNGIHTIYNVPADTGSHNKTTYYRFRDSTVVTGSDTATANWDIAFKSTTIFTNSGSSGRGQGGAVVLKNVNFSDVTEASQSGYDTDSTGAPAIPTGSGKGWYLYNFTTNIISPIAGVVLVIRTGDGKYAKVQILSYYKDAPANPASGDKPRFYSFKYFYQPNGSRNLK